MTELTRELVASWLPNRPEDGHKGTFGKVDIVAGCEGLTGAPVLAARAAVRGGTGLVFLQVPRAIYPIVAAKCEEAMASPLPDQAGKLSGAAAEAILERMNQCDAGLIGPGLGQSGALDSLVMTLIARACCPLVLDADGLNAVSRHMNGVCHAISSRQAPCILTPHDGEYERLAQRWPGEDREAAACALARMYHSIVVLKGHRTVIASPEGACYRNTTGNHGMAKGGSGDALAGLILSLLGQGMDPLRAAAAGVWIHGRAGDRAAREKSFRGMTPSDLIEALPLVWRDDFSS